MKKHVLVAGLLATIISSSFAASLGDVEATLKARYPATTFTSVREAEVEGLYEVVMRNNVAYTDKTGRYFIIGRMLDMQTQTDLTAERQAEANKLDFDSLPLKDAIKKVKGDGSRRMAVFTDPDCPYCKRLEGELAKMDNVTIYIFPYPLEQLHPDAVRKSVAIWCAKDNVKAWDDFMLKGVLPPDGKCANPISKIIEFGQKLGINGTPTIIMGNGRKVSGALPVDKLEASLQAGGSSLSGKPVRVVSEGK